MFEPTLLPILLDSYSSVYSLTSFGTYKILKYNLVLRTICVHVHELNSVEFELFAHQSTLKCKHAEFG